MTLDERKKKLAYCTKMAAQTQTRIRRLNTALRNWQRRAKHYEKEIAKLEVAVLIQRVSQLESELGKRPRRAISLEEVK